MTFELRAVGRSKVSDEIVGQILEGIRSGAFGPGTVLPPERSLAERFGVSRGSVREAIRSLEYAGVLDVRTGSGTFVAEAGATKAAALRARAALVGEHSPLDLVVARRAIEPVCAGLAAANRSAADLGNLRRLVDEQTELLRRGQETAEVDLRFHVAVATACHNPVLAMLYDRIAEIMRQDIWLDLRRRSRALPGTPQLYLGQHRATLEAIERGDSDAASRAVNAHIHTVEERLEAEVESRP
jgi:GntR family transcriptional regulator, transcriptional repressor for pyruvate dehydrogenase complex